MGTSLGVSDTMALISSKLTTIIPWSGCCLLRYQPDTRSLACRFSAGADAPKLLNAALQDGDGLARWVAGDRRLLANADPRRLFESAGVAGDTRLRSAIMCPLYFDETFIGCLALYHVEAHRYTEDHRRLLDRVAEQAGAVIHNSMVFERTQEDSLTDPLTALPNRRSLFAYLTRELARAARLNGEVALIMMDVDDFKTINDTYGHHVGDDALRAVSAALLSCLRPYDLCVRYAGDEFVIVLDDCTQESAEIKRCELQSRVAAIELAVGQGRTLRLAASAGGAVFPHDGTSYETLLAEADHLMYRDKAARRAGLRSGGERARSNPVAPDLLDIGGPVPAILPQSLN